VYSPQVSRAGRDDDFQVELADLSVGLPVGIVVSVRLIKSVEKTAQLPLPEGGCFGVL
jgi:hypothetical protein